VVLGEDAFHALVLDFLTAEPPHSFSLRHLGQSLPAFLRGPTSRRARPWLADLAALEWARVEAYDRADASPLGLADLQRLPPERFAELPLRAVPALIALEVAGGVDELWRAIEAGSSPVDPSGAPQPLVVWRQGVDVYHRKASPAEAHLLPLLIAGTTFGLLCERLAAERAPEEAARLAFELLAAWARDGLAARPAELDS
jgi:hypothetical protein